MEFSVQGEVEGDPVSGRGWAVLEKNGDLTGNIYFHLADESGFRATPLR